MTRLERAFAILLLLSDGRTVTAAALARQFEVSVRTIYRDVEMLSLTGIPIYGDRGHSGGYRLLEGYFLPPIAFTRTETVGLLLGLALVRSLRVTPFAAELETAERKLVAALPKQLRPLLAESRRLIGFEQSAADAFHPEMAAEGGADEAKAVEVFLRAVLDGTRVRFLYRSPYGRPDAPEIEAEPLGLLWDRDRWYLIGNRLDDGGRRFWRADRIARIAPSTLRASAAKAFDVRRHLGRAWLAEAMASWARTSPVRIRMTAAQGERLKADWYFSFAHYAVDPGGVIMTYGESDPAKTLELVRWLGPGAELLEPAAWRSMLAGQLRAMLANV